MRVTKICVTGCVLVAAIVLATATDARATVVGPGASITATGVDQELDTLNVSQNVTNLSAGSHIVSDFAFQSFAGWPLTEDDGGTVTPFLVTSSPSTYTTIWVGPTVNIPAAGLWIDTYDSESFTLASAADVYAGYFVEGGRIAFNDNASCAPWSGILDDLDIRPFDDPTVGSTVTDFLLESFERTYAFEIAVDGVSPVQGASELPVPEPSTLVLLAAGFLGLLVCARRKRK